MSRVDPLELGPELVEFASTAKTVDDPQPGDCLISQVRSLRAEVQALRDNNERGFRALMLSVAR